MTYPEGKVLNSALTCACVSTNSTEFASLIFVALPSSLCQCRAPSSKQNTVFNHQHCTMLTTLNPYNVLIQMYSLQIRV